MSAGHQQDFGQHWTQSSKTCWTKTLYRLLETANRASDGKRKRLPLPFPPISPVMSMLIIRNTELYLLHPSPFTHISGYNHLNGFRCSDVHLSADHCSEWLSSASLYDSNLGITQTPSAWKPAPPNRWAARDMRIWLYSLKKTKKHKHKEQINFTVIVKVKVACLRRTHPICVALRPTYP